MTSLLIKAAGYALSESRNLVTGKFSENQASQNALPISYTISHIGAWGGALVALIALFAKTYFTFFGGTLFSLTSGLAAFYIKKLHAFKTLEQYTKALTERVQDLAKLVLQLKDEDEKLALLNNDFKRIPENWKRQIEEGQKLLQQKTFQLEEVVKKLDLAEKKLEKFSQLPKEIQRQNEKISQSVSLFIRENSLLGGDIKKIEEHLSDLNTKNSNFGNNISKLDEQNDQTEKIIEVYKKQNKIFKELFSVLQTLYKKAKEEMLSLGQEVEKLNNVVQKAENNTHEIQQLALRYEKIAEKFFKKEENK